MIWGLYCGNIFKHAECLINFEVKKFTISSCTTRREKVHWWRPAGLITVPWGEPVFPRVLLRLVCTCLMWKPQQRHSAPWLLPRSQLLGMRRPGSALCYKLQQWSWQRYPTVEGVMGACVCVCVCECQAAGERTLKDLPSEVKKIEVMFVFGALAMSAQLYTL